MDSEPAGLSPPSSPRSQEASSPDQLKNSYHEFFPPITTASLPSALQDRIACQSWEKVSVRQPIGSYENTPDGETLYDFASTILETRLAEVVKHRLDAKLFCSLTGNKSHNLAHTMKNDIRLAMGGGEIISSPATLTESFASSTDSFTSPTVLLTSNCRSQLRAYVRRIASMYRDNRYHGLEHALHVTMSANKLLEMLHVHDGDDSLSDDDDEEVNDFLVSEPCIMKEAAASKLDKSARNGSFNSINSFISENGHKSSRGPQKSEATVWRSSFSQDFDDDSSALRSYSEDFDSHAVRPTKKRPKSKSKSGSSIGSSTHLAYSDTFTKFAFVFAAMIHDVDHQGVPNTRLVLENDPIVEVYGGTSAAEKHSIKVAFRTLNEDEFDEFRAVVFASPDDQLQMHCIVTNAVVSTDIASPERMQSTKIRWDEAFSHPLPENGPIPFGRLSLAGHIPSSEIATVQASKPQLVPMNNDSATVQHHARQQRKNSLTKRVMQLNGGLTVEYFAEHNQEGDKTRAALRHSVVIETMLNVADVAHSMQSWELFCFWNRKLFEELYFAFKTKRSGNDPSNDWYKNQLGFYKLYVIPLAEKMKTCGVFGERGEKWVKNAILIRDRWSREGEQLTEDMIASVKIDIERCCN